MQECGEEGKKLLSLNFCLEMTNSSLWLCHCLKECLAEVTESCAQCWLPHPLDFQPWFLLQGSSFKKDRRKVIRKMEWIEYIIKVMEKLTKIWLFCLKSWQMQCDITEIRSCWRLEVQLREWFFPCSYILLWGSGFSYCLWPNRSTCIYNGNYSNIIFFRRRQSIKKNTKLLVKELQICFCVSRSVVGLIHQAF